MNKTKTLLFTGLAAAAMFAGQACATPVIDPGEPPPPGWVLNLNGQRDYNTPFPHYVQYTAYFTATQTTTHITFALLDSTFDSFSLDNIAVAQLNSPGVNLIQNGGFEGGTAPSGGNASAPVDWQYLNPSGLLESGSVSCSRGPGGHPCAWTPGAGLAYDFITQSIPTALFDTYQISFLAEGPDEGSYWQELNTVSGRPPQPEGNSFNIAVYPGSIPTPAVPEPPALGMFGLGVLLIGGFFTLRSREQRQA